MMTCMKRALLLCVFAAVAVAQVNDISASAYAPRKVPGQRFA